MWTTPREDARRSERKHDKRCAQERLAYIHSPNNQPVQQRWMVVTLMPCWTLLSDFNQFSKRARFRKVKIKPCGFDFLSGQLIAPSGHSVDLRAPRRRLD
jgi:hypothetical protein